MIGNPPFANNLSRIRFEGLENNELVNLIKNEQYKEGDAYGFAVEKAGESLLSAHLLLTRPEVRQVFDKNTQSVEETEITTIRKIPFRVDFKYNILEVFADQDSSSNVTNKLGQLTNWDVTVETANFTPLEVLESVERKYTTEVTSIKISNYHASDSIVGDFSADIEDQEVASSLLSQHAGDLSYLGVRVETEFDSVTLGIYNSGSIVVYNEMDELTEVLDLIKESVTGGDHYA
jgi:hypothetical protein